MRILITGGCGFIGTNTAEHYASKGDEVVVFDNLSKQRLAKDEWRSQGIRKYNWNYLSRFRNVYLVPHIFGDVRKPDQVFRAAKGCDYIIHAAAQTSMVSSIEDPRTDFEINALGTFNVLEAARRFDIPLVYCSTADVYGNVIDELHWLKRFRVVSLVEDKKRFRATVGNPLIDEGFPIGLGTLSPVGCSKLAGDLYAQEYAKVYGLDTAVFRLSCVYGPKQFGREDQEWFAHFVIRALLEQPIKIFGGGKQVRDILYVTDVAEVFDCFYEKRSRGVYNIGGGENNTMSALEFIDLIEKITGRRPEVRYGLKRSKENRYFACDISKAKQELGWEPKVSAERGVSMLINWVKENESIFHTG